MTSLLIMELAAAAGDIGLLAKLGFQSDLGLSMLFDARLRPAYLPARVDRALVTTIDSCYGQRILKNCPSIVCLDAIRQLRSNIWANWYTSGLYEAVSYT